MQKPWEIDLTIYHDETELLAGLRERDRMACTCLLKHFAPRLYRMALQLTGGSDEAEDVLQESFIQACAHIDDFEGHSGLGTWLHRIVLNTALMRLRRKQSNMLSLDERWEEEPAPGIELAADPAGMPDSTLLAQELRDRVEHAILDLPDRLRAAVVLRDISGLSTREAAEALGIGEPALKVRLHRGRLALRAALGPYLQAAGEPAQAGA